jgi:tRNA threonylcarbamoyladenosine biosynthesis protein TsaE
MNTRELKFLGMRDLNSLAATDEFAKEIVTQIKPRHVIGLQGEMGSGKTHFVKALTKHLGCPVDEANSPSYAIHQEYQGSNISLQHVDLYRLESAEEVESSGFWDLFYEQNSIIIIEWVDRIDQAMIPQDCPYLRLEWNIHEGDKRNVRIYKRE